MSEEKKPGKRLVSKREYAVHLGKKTAMLSLGTFFVLFGFGAMGSAWRIVWASHKLGWIYSSGFLVVSVILEFFGIFLIGIGVLTCKTINKMKAVQPMNSQNTGHLSAEETLVRASEEPLTEQKTILLRAAQESQLTPAEQLLRPLEWE